MNILTTTGGTQTLKFIPRVYNDLVNVSITNRNTKEVVTFSADTTSDSGYQLVEYNFSLIEGTFYTYEVSANAVDGKIVYRGQIFCTDQTDYDNYEMNKDQYITSDDKDDTIIIF